MGTHVRPSVFVSSQLINSIYCLCDDTLNTLVSLLYEQSKAKIRSDFRKEHFLTFRYKSLFKSFLPQGGTAHCGRALWRIKVVLTIFILIEDKQATVSAK